MLLVQMASISSLHFNYLPETSRLGADERIDASIWSDVIELEKDMANRSRTRVCHVSIAEIEPPACILRAHKTESQTQPMAMPMSCIMEIMIPSA